jgi:FAD/FMN-containing dehydrogenase
MSLTYAVDDDRVSWGRVVRARHHVVRPRYEDELGAALSRAAADGRTALPVGLGRSYGDSNLNPDGALIDLSALDRIIAFDATTGVLRVEAGASLSEILRFCVPRGWFLPTTPGTRFVTIAGAVANDVHGKNHQSAGAMGCWVRRIGLVRSDRGALELSLDDESDLFAATIGGLGLTGVIAWVELQLVRVPSAYIDQEIIPFGNLDDFFAISKQSHPRFEHTASWIDCTATGGDAACSRAATGRPPADMRRMRTN